MKREEAEQVFGMVAAIYDLHPERAADLATVWVPALENLDAQATMTIVFDLTRGIGPPRIPSVVQFVADVKAVQRRERPAVEAAPIEPSEMPDWYRVWFHLRARGDQRVLLEQLDGYLHCGYEWPADQVVPREEQAAILARLDVAD